MNVAQIRCLGCNKGFTHNGLIQHTRKTQNVHCRTVYSASQTHLRFSTGPHAVSSLASIPSLMPRINPDEASSDDEPGLVGNNDSDLIENPFNDCVDLADATDADAFEMLSCGTNVGVLPSHLPRPESIETPLAAISEDAGQPPTRIETGESGITVIIDHFPFGSAGAPITGPHGDATLNGPGHVDPRDSIWAPFRSQCDWEIAHWAKMSGPTSSAVTELLAIPEVWVSLFNYRDANVSRQVVEKLDLSYRSTRELNTIIDNDLPGPPPFQCRELVIGHEHLLFFCRDALQCIRSLYGNPEFVRDLVFAPEHHYTNDERTCRIVNEMHTGDWWWTVQVRNEL